MPLDIDLNLNPPCIDTNVFDGTTSTIDMDCIAAPPASDFHNNGDRALLSRLDHPPSRIPIDLNVCSSYEEEEEQSGNDSEDSLCSFDGHELDEVDAIVNGIQHDPNDGADKENNATLIEENIQNESQPSKKQRTFLDNDQRKLVCQMLINSSHEGKLKRGTIKWVASTFSVSIDVVYRIWKQLKQTGDACHKKTGKCGPKRVEMDIEKLRDIPLAKRSNLRALACALGISKTTLLKYLREGVLRRHSNTIKPYMTDVNMKARLRFCVSMLEESSIPHDPMFKSMHNVVHIDEKWFYMCKKSTNYYLLASENEPYRTCKNKNSISKVMFLVAVARPRFDHEGIETFSGKIGVFPLVNKVPAKRSSVNRVAGTLETKPITSITKEVSRMFLINKVLPAIKEKWPRESAGSTIYIQQDNARSHVSVDDEEFCRAASEDGFNIRLTCQPPNSPDLNVLDLGFFNAIQSLQQQEVTRSVDELIEVVQKSFDAFSSKVSNKIFLTLQSCMIDIMKVKGSNSYKIPHMKKDAMFHRGELPCELKCDPELVREVFDYLQNVN